MAIEEHVEHSESLNEDASSHGRTDSPEAEQAVSPAGPERQIGDNALETSGPAGAETDALMEELAKSPATSMPASSGSASQGMIAGVRFSASGQVFFFAAPEQTVRVGTKVLVKLEQGAALGEVASLLDAALGKFLGEPLGKITGLATAQDIALDAENRILTAEASAFCKTCIRQRDLDMKLVDVEVLHDRSKIIFFFTAPSRIDFRELVKDLVRNYRTRIELRQIGVRHETQMIGGIGNCGSVCCCHRFLRKFAPVTIKMAKEQNLFLNPAKLSGMCGRLLCCLAYEQENYDEFHKRSPKIGKKYKTDSGIVKVMRANLFRQSIFVLDEANVESEYQLEEWEALHPQRYDQPGQSGPAGSESDRRQEQRSERPRRNEREERRAAPRPADGPGDSGDSDGPAEEAGSLRADELADAEAAEVLPAGALAGEAESGQDDAFPPLPAEDGTDEPAAGPAAGKPGDKSIFGLPGSRYAEREQPDNASRGRPPGPRPDNRAEGGGRRNNNHKHGNRHKPSKKVRNPGGGQG